MRAPLPISRIAILTSIAAVAAAGAVLSFVGGDDLQASVTASQGGSAGKGGNAVGPEERLARLLAKLERRKANAPSDEAFRVPDWNPPVPAMPVLQAVPPTPPSPAVEPKPEAPPLPFVYIGHMSVQGKIELFLGRGAEGISVKAGDVVGETHRVDEITEQNARFTHLPTGIQQTLTIPSGY